MSLHGGNPKPAAIKQVKLKLGIKNKGDRTSQTANNSYLTTRFNSSTQGSNLGHFNETASLNISGNITQKGVFAKNLHQPVLGIGK